MSEDKVSYFHVIARLRMRQSSEEGCTIPRVQYIFEDLKSI